MRKYLYLFVFIFINSNPLAGQEQPNQEAEVKRSMTTEEMSAEKAQEQAKVALQTLLLSMQNYQAMFVQTVTDAQGELLQESEGQIFLKQPDRLYWEIAEPNETTLIADGTTLWHVDPFVEQVIAMDQSQAVANNPMILLTSSNINDWAQFDVVQRQHSFDVISRDPESQISKLTLTFTGMTMTGLQFSDRTEQVNQLIFEQVKQNQNIGDELFDFALPPGFELDDQR